MTSKLYLVFEDINSIMPATQEGDRYVFRNIPLGRKVKIVGIGYINKTPQLVVTNSKVSKSELQISGFKPFKLDELKKELNSF